MPRASEIEPIQYLRSAFVSPPGAGKTWLAATFPRPAFIDTDRGIRTVVNPEFRKRYPDQDPIFEQFDDERDPKTGLFKSAKGFWQVIEQVNKWGDDPSIDTVVLDSATTFSDLCQHVALEINQSSKRSQTLTEGRNRKAILPAIQDFGAEMNLFEQFMDQFVGLPKHIIVICHERVDTNDKGAVTSIGPLLTGSKLRAKFAKWFDEVWAIEVYGSATSRKRKLITGSTNLRTNLKSRLGLPAEIDDPDYGKIAKLVHEAQAAFTPPLAR